MPTAEDQFIVRGDSRPIDKNTPLVAHVIHSLGVGGLENGLVNLINHTPPRRYRHAVVCMTDFTDFRNRLWRDDVEVIAMKRGSVPLWRTYLDLVKLFRRLQPSVVHTRNLSGLDALLPALLAGVRVRVQGEHGRDLDDLQGTNAKYRRMRRFFRPLITHYTTVSKDLASYLEERIGVPRSRISQIYNGVDTACFRPRSAQDREPRVGEPDADSAPFVIGTVGRLQPVKDQSTLVRAFAEACKLDTCMSNARLVLVGDGPLRSSLESEIRATGIGARIVMLGERPDVYEIMRTFDIFVLPSRDEGISNTILEAMASGLPVIATRVGGNPELVVEGEVGQLVPAQGYREMAEWMVRYARDAALRRRQSVAARSYVETKFSMSAMVESYLSVYDRLRARREDARTLGRVKNST